VDGYGISLRVLYGKLRVEDGIADRRRSIVLDRAGLGLERLVLLGKTGAVTLEAFAWLRAIGAALVHIGPDGALLTHSVPYGYSGLPIRRAQALAAVTGLDVTLARDLIREKLAGQRSNLVRLGARDLSAFDRLHASLDGAHSIDEIRLVEAKAAAIHWSQWSKITIHFKGRDLARIPVRWTRYESRASILTGAPRAATNPVNALINYCHALAESESRLALLSAGLDPTLGVLHADQRNRDSFALDAMEPIRPQVEAFVLDLLEGHTFSSRDFTELPNGVCRLRAPLTHDLALTLPRWRLHLAPIVANLAQAFRSALTDPDKALPPRLLRQRKPAISVPNMGIAPRTTSAQSPLRSTPRKNAQVRPYASKAWNAPRTERLALIPTACAICGEPIEMRRRRHCATCMPTMRRAHGERAIERARKALALQVRAGNDPRASAEAGRKRGDANAEHHRRNREWKREQGAIPGRDRAWFRREITPKLDGLSLLEIANATGLSLAACSRFRAGTRIPHARHWEAFLTLVEVT
jgi:CRISPR-associated endonuclease Cas1